LDAAQISINTRLLILFLQNTKLSGHFC